MARASARILDSGDTFPTLEIQTVNHGSLKVPEGWRGKWGALLLYRGHW